MLKELKQFVPAELYNRWFVFFLLSAIATTVLLKFKILKTIVITLLFIQLFFLILYKLKVKFDNKIDTILYWLVFAILASSTMGYISSSVKETNISLISIFLAPLIMVTIPLILHLNNLWRSKDMKKKNISIMILSYIFVTILIVLLFAPIYELTGIFEGSGIMKVPQNIKLEDNLEYFYFSASIFYSNAFNDTIPTGYSKLIVIVESVISFIIHIIVLGIVISKFGIDYKSQK